MDIRISLLEHFGIVSSGLCGRIHNKEERLHVSACLILDHSWRCGEVFSPSLEHGCSLPDAWPNLRRQVIVLWWID